MGRGSKSAPAKPPTIWDNTSNARANTLTQFAEEGPSGVPSTPRWIPKQRDVCKVVGSRDTESKKLSIWSKIVGQIVQFTGTLKRGRYYEVYVVTSDEKNK